MWGRFHGICFVQQLLSSSRFPMAGAGILCYFEATNVGSKGKEWLCSYVRSS